MSKNKSIFNLDYEYSVVVLSRLGRFKERMEKIRELTYNLLSRNDGAQYPREELQVLEKLASKKEDE